MIDASGPNPLDLKVGDTVKLTGWRWANPYRALNRCVKVTAHSELGTPIIRIDGATYFLRPDLGGSLAYEVVHRAEAEQLEPEFDPVNSPNYYVMPDGTETVAISKWLTSAGGQAVQYIVRATRADGIVKENPVEDLEKAMFWLQVELDRVKGAEDG